ncbi:hypothetical protein AB0M87_01210 [Streptomyces sp. NPDC051320]|uniref:hypothetical protein n=1 Tax=Streptomyces sp. NPDC051320 TaxID=3154644 RepID=UPI00342CCD1E
MGVTGSQSQCGPAPSDRQGPIRFTRSDVCSRACPALELRQACAPGPPRHSPSPWLACGDAGPGPDHRSRNRPCHLTPHGDPAGAGAIAGTIGTDPVVTATRSTTGHLPGVSGALGATVAIVALRGGAGRCR